MSRAFLLILLSLGILGYAADTRKIGSDKKVTAFELKSVIKLDGRLTEEVWKNKPVDEFTQRDPNEGQKCSEVTNVWVAYDKEALYIAAKMFDSHPDSIVGLLSRRDYSNESDWFGVYIDPYLDRRSGYYFAVNPAGSIVDGILFNDSWNDDSWNGIWDYGVSKTNDGWIVEIKIPYTQIRFNQNNEMQWGINFTRIIQRKNETAYFIMVPKNESGFVSHFATLEGLKNIKPRQRFELMPYFVSKASYLVHDAADPFYKSRQYTESFGGDLKIGLGSNLTLDVTINPDFGQVEVDPAVVNLTAFETYYQEKRPFFIEGNNIFMFGFGGSNNNWGFNFGSPEIFYSRRIGREPHYTPDFDGYMDSPSSTRILGAAKMTGKIGGDWSVGVINATTERTYTRLFNETNIISEQVEPLTNFSILRIQKEFNSGKEGLGFIGSGVIRDLKTDALRGILNKNSFVVGSDGWFTIDDEEIYVLNGFASFSNANGSKEQITALQSSPIRYMQRPDAVNFRLDSSRTSLSGFAGRLALNKQKGNFYVNTAIGIISPGYDINDAGFQFRSDVINSHLVLGYRWFEPDGIFRRKDLYAAHYRNYNFDRLLTDIGFMAFTDLQFVNYWGLNIQGGYNPETYNTRVTRGGPLVMRPDSWSGNFSMYTDNREKLVLNFSGYYEKDKLGSYFKNISTDLTWKPNSTLNFSFGPFFEVNDDRYQWIDRFEDAFSPTYGFRYVFGYIHQTTLGGNIRLNWTFTPALSLQLFLQPLFSVGDYKEFKELAQSGTNKTHIYAEGSEIIYDKGNDEYIVDPDGTGPAGSFSFSNPDFNFKSLRGNIVLRWEFMPGSVFFLVWTHEKTNSDDPGNFSFGRDFRNLWRTGSNNVILAKVSYWLDI